jgi:hypothetical protein
VPAGRSTTATAALGLAPERLCGPAGTRPGVAQQRLCVSSLDGCGEGLLFQVKAAWWRGGAGGVLGWRDTTVTWMAMSTCGGPTVTV